MKHIIDSEAVEKLHRYYQFDDGYLGEANLGIGQYVKLDDLRALLASSPKADDLVKVAIEQCAKIAEKYEPDEKPDCIDYASKEIRRLLATEAMTGKS